MISSSLVSLAKWNYLSDLSAPLNHSSRIVGMAYDDLSSCPFRPYELLDAASVAKHGNLYLGRYR